MRKIVLHSPINFRTPNIVTYWNYNDHKLGMINVQLEIIIYVDELAIVLYKRAATVWSDGDYEL